MNEGDYIETYHKNLEEGRKLTRPTIRMPEKRVFDSELVNDNRVIFRSVFRHFFTLYNILYDRKL